MLVESGTDALAQLAARGIEFDASRRRLAEYSSDASNYRLIPTAVVFPRHADEVAELVDIAHRTGVPVTPRGGGTSVAGNAVGRGLVLDFSRHMTAIHSVDAESATAVVDPGVVQSDLQRAAAGLGLRFGPDPSTADRCTIGGMIGNNACGPRTLRFGRTADNVRSIDLVDGRGRLRTAGAGLLDSSLESLVRSNLATLRTEFGGFSRQVSGYSLEHLLPENGRDLAKAFVGTEGTWGITTRATVSLVPLPVAPILVVLGYSDMIAAAGAVQRLLPHRPLALEGMDSRLVDAVRALRGPSAVPELPRGGGWLFVEMDGVDARADAAALVRDAGALDSRVVDGAAARALWRARADGVGLAGRTSTGRQAWPGVEDAAVPPENLGDYLREFDELVASYGMEGMPYGHFGDGCIHVRLDIPLEHDGRVLGEFMHDAARLITRHGGSLSGEHGDGRARSELLPYMYSPDALALMAAVKHEFDPDDLLNPGVVVDPEPLTASLRRPAAGPVPVALGFAFAHDAGDLTMAAHRCVGVGRCRADTSSAGGFMCPSYQATKDEKDSTRGRARVLQEVINGSFIGGWDSPELAESLDLCLSCKACSNDCPAGVDMAAMKSEVLHRRFRGKLRPISHYTLGWMPRWARLATSFSRPLNALLSIRPLERLVLRAGGMDSRRSIPRFATKRFSSAHRRRAGGAATGTKRVLLWADTFSDNFSPEIGHAAVRVLEGAGFRVGVPSSSACCGLTWITTGQLDGAKRRLSDLLDLFYPAAADGIPIVGLEPSCTAVLRGDLLELLPDDPRAPVVAAAATTLAELLTATDDWEGPDLTGVDVLAQPHCHQHSVMGFDTDAALLRGLGAELDVISGCCGLAGNFGMEKGHYETSVAVAENALLPALRAAPTTTIVLADGLSCRTQASQLGGRSPMHLAELLDPQRSAGGAGRAAKVG
ncbi:FAD-binding and (Fe-S)-binding domain-containing protein [Herbiconiux sp. L3-i23]|uniref:FAD-binding and (Fe-S)-binding domain-containing protein n=1 Tax=Herbiconiux sp. L3-i23 TaxID=2905871 RepID=UPI002045BC45|nr:FAD-binding and (Fe-S)-binding domain-containing protein [Herbiconiux sp. L3-i23]BDI23501.1 lactate dehydrogenase [Herbiconiux sp. L3-i23]